MAVFPDRIVLKNSTDNQASIVSAIESGGTDAITQGEVVLGLEQGDTKLYTLDSNGDVIVISTSSSAGRAIISTTAPTVGIGNLPLAEGDLWFNPDVTVYYVRTGGVWVPASSGSPGASNLDELSDVSISASPTTNDILVYNGSNWQNQVFVPSWPMTQRGDITYYDNTDATRLGIGNETQVLTVIGGVPTWQNPGTGALDLGDLGDVELPDILQGGVTLVYDAIDEVWKPGTTDGLGTVVSVGVDAPNGGIVVANSPVTDSGVISLDLEDKPDVTPGIYYAANIQVNEKGIITTIESGGLGDLDGVDLETKQPVDGDVLVYDSLSGNWLPEQQADGGIPVLSIDDLTDVDTSTDPPVNGEVLTWDNNNLKWEPAPPAGGAEVLNDLTDVDAGSPSDGNTLSWDSSANKWIAGTVGAGSVVSVDGTGQNGITVTNGPITSSGSLIISLDDTGVSAGSYGSANITVDAQGRITSASEGFVNPMSTTGDIIVQTATGAERLAAGTEGQVLAIDASGAPYWTVVTSDSGGTVSSVDVVGGTGISSTGGPVTDSGSITVALEPSGVAAGTYNKANITVDSQGRVVAARDGLETAEVEGVYLDDVGLSGTSLVLDNPGSSEGNLLIAVVVNRTTGGALTAPSGWELQGNYLTLTDGIFTQSLSVFTKKSTSSEPVNYTWTQGSVSLIAGYIAVIDNGFIETVAINETTDTDTSVVAANNRLNLIASTWIYTGVAEAYSTTGTNVTQISSSPTDQAILCGAYTNIGGNVSTTHTNVDFSASNTNNGMINIIIGIPDDKIDDLADVDTTTNPPTNGQALIWDGTNWVPGDVAAENSGGSAAGLYLSEEQTGASGFASYTALGFSGTIQQATSDVDAWVVLYSTAAARTADSARNFEDDPSPGSGVLFEAYIEAGTTVQASPGTNYFNGNVPATEEIYAMFRTQNKVGIDATVTINAYGLAAITTITGGTFGSGL